MTSSLGRVLRSHEAILALVVVVVMIAIGIINPAFWQVENLFSLLRSNIVIGTMALGVTTVLISGGIDVSFTAIAAIAMYAALRLTFLYVPDSVVIPILIGLVVGIALGFVNAALVHFIRIIPLIATLATGAIIRGLLLGAIGAKIVNIDTMPPALVEAGRAQLASLTAGDGSQAGIPLAFLAYALVAILLHFFLSNTLTGRGLFAVGGDPEAASRVGFNVRSIRFVAYGLAGALAGLAGVIHAAINWTGEPRAFDAITLDVLAAVILGGASIFGGRGSVVGTVLGVFLLVLISNSLIILGVPTTWQRVFLGGAIIVVAAAAYLRERRL